MELPSYTGAISAFRNVGADLVGVPQDIDGINLEELDRVFLAQRAAGRRIKFLYLVPNFQNPTGLLIGAGKRPRLIEWADARDVLIVEDDPYRDLFFPDAASASETRPLAADDSAGRVIYLSSFSKTLAPGLRVGWISAAPAIAAKLELAKQASDLCTGVLDQRLVFECCRRGILDRHVPELRALYQRKRDAMIHGLMTSLPGALSWPAPRGGFFLWVTLPAGVRASALLERAKAHGVLFVTGTAFFVDGTGEEYVRLSFSAPSIERIYEGTRRFAAALQEARTAGAAAPAAGSASA
jgi:2-aminoadipate transaminase